MKITLKALDERIETVGKMGVDYNNYIHETAVMLLRFCAPKEAGGEGHGDCSRALTLIKAMPASMRRTSLMHWFLRFTPIRVKLSQTGDKVGYVESYKALSPEDKVNEWHIDDANAMPFYSIAEATPEKEAMSYLDIVNLVAKLGKKIEKEITEGKVRPEDVPSAMNVVATVKALRFDYIKPEAPVDQDNTDDQAPLRNAA